MAMILAVAACATACQEPGGQLFRTTLPTSAYQPLPLVLRDQTGLVIGIEAAALDKPTFGDPLVLADPSDPDAFTVSWIGGLCESDAALSLWRSASQYFLQIAVTRGGTGCPMAGVVRGLRIKTSSPIPVDSIRVFGGG
jgi:hypothetical protein